MAIALCFKHADRDIYLFSLQINFKFTTVGFWFPSGPHPPNSGHNDRKSCGSDRKTLPSQSFLLVVLISSSC